MEYNTPCSIELMRKDGVFIDRVKVLMLKTQLIFYIWRVCTFEDVQQDLFKINEHGFIRIVEIENAMKDLALQYNITKTELLLLLPKDVADHAMQKGTLLRSWVDQGRLLVQSYPNSLAEIDTIDHIIS